MSDDAGKTTYHPLLDLISQVTPSPVSSDVLFGTKKYDYYLDRSIRLGVGGMIGGAVLGRALRCPVFFVGAGLGFGLGAVAQDYVSSECGCEARPPVGIQIPPPAAATENSSKKASH
eukprot:gnl/Spiro4/24504_TR12144_c0_g1_i1.p1 gnl/Spiro4/24504_TR12144_c0_g1~~gnl/Spiro4/24504_TR12144_c0_g1_i1.p1  ORF type:complete len:130 (+),score=30.13 gnl/Spiro4/24504_TR12144_c0_g1_i1:40-390(+)